MTPQLPHLNDEIRQAMLADQSAFRRRLRRLKRHNDAEDFDHRLSRLRTEIRASMARRAERHRRLPRPSFPEALPISIRRDEIAKLIEENQVSIICGDTGSGKTTQLPKICLSIGRGVAGLIGHTQPRRIAARSVTARIAHELGSRVGDVVGFKIRFQDQIKPDAYIKLMTDGILLAELQTDSLLRQYDTLIIDEAHERSLNIDFLLGHLRSVLTRRPDLKLIITSATINPDHFSRHFDDAPVLEVSGRTFPVAVQYRPLPDGDEADVDRQTHIADTVKEIAGGDKGDVLVFLSGEREIRETAGALSRQHLTNTEVVPLYGRLSGPEQDRVFTPSRQRRVVLATNVAETSLTVPNIGYVVDPGFARISRYSYRNKIQRLPIEEVSKASAEQRKGRCGRVGPGECIRLYSEEDYERRPNYTEPEVRRTNLAAVILRMKSLDLGDIADFPFLDAPDHRYISDGLRLLRELDAIDTEERLTHIGRKLARFPVDPRIGRMVLAAHEENSLREVLIIGSALSLRDPLERPLDRREAANEAQQRFRDKRSDFMTYLNLWSFFHERARHVSKNKLRRLCRDHFVSWLRMREWQDVHRQLTELAREIKLSINTDPADFARIHRALLAGSLGLIGLRSEGSTYTGPRNSQFNISPASALHGANAKWVMAAELIETRRVYAHRAARIRPKWVEQAAPDYLLTKTYSEPYFDARRSRVFGHERVTLYGLPIVARRRRPYDTVNPEEARDIFVAHGLVEGRLRTAGEFLEHNRLLIAKLEELEHKSRRADILIDDARIGEFYEQRIPSHIVQGSRFEDWRREAERHDPHLLFLTTQILCRDDAPAISEVRFPNALTINGQQFPLRYLLEPGGEFDGITVTIPAAMLNQLAPQPFEWLVPGLLREKVIALMRTLPKSLRRHFVPAPEFADACLTTMVPGEGRLVAQISAQLRRMTGVDVPADAWRPQRLPPHLRINFQIVDAELEPVAHGRDLDVLRGAYAKHGEHTFELLRVKDFDKDGLVDWTFDELPPEVEFSRGEMRLKGYPALIDEGKTVSVRLLDSPEKAERATRSGLLRLLLLKFARDVKYLRRNLPNIQNLCLLYASVSAPEHHAEVDGKNGSCDTLKQDIIEAAFGRCFLSRANSLRNRADYTRLQEQGKPELISTTNTICELVFRILQHHHAVQTKRRELADHAAEESLRDIDSQLRHLVYQGFVPQIEYDHLQHLPRYLRALEQRLTKLESAPGKDPKRMREVAQWWQRYLEIAEPQPKDVRRSPELEEIRWMIEELRVATFAQNLGTAYPISAKRIEVKFQALSSSLSRVF